jgi:hypothetical protein
MALRPVGARLAIVGVVVLLATACDRAAERAADWLEESATPVPVSEDRMAYVGTWRGEGMAISIAPDGMVRYWREKDGGQRSMTAPLRGFEGDDFEIGIAGITTTFDVQEPPKEEDGAWSMTVDGVELTRTSKLAEDVAPGREGDEAPQFGSEGTAI